ncbi:MAG: redox-regulated ATPase YchF [Simkaniaceae bacterium]|nr:redox-regulated ATPase YchF [Simkaniaceae bacterium]
MTSLSCGIVGLPNVGKSTLFNALLKKIAAAASNFPFCTIEPNKGIVDLHDPRLAALSKLSGSKKLIPAAVTFLDIAGLVEGASKGEGLGNQFLSNIRSTDAIIHVVRCFDDDNVIHVSGKVDPISDIEIINLELIFSDLQMVDNTISKAERLAKGDKKLLPTIDVLKKIQVHLNDNHPVRSLELSNDERESIKQYDFITAKRVIYVANVAEDDLPSMENAHVRAVKAYAEKQGAEVLPICAKLEEELASLSPDDAAEYLKDLGLKQSGLNRLIKTAFHTLGLITFLTTGEQETRAWTIAKGTNAQNAAGKIHTDISKGFIRAETIAYDDFITAGSRNAAKEAGKARAEGKEYIVQDGDVILFFHN